MARAGLNHWMLHNDRLAAEYDEALKLSPSFDPVRDVDPALTFYAPLVTGPDSIPGNIRAIFERNSEATYRAPRGAFLLSAGDHESLHEYAVDGEPLGVSMAPASTSKCLNYNANADDALTGMRTDDIADGILSAELDADALHLSGLSALVGKVFFLDNRGNGSDSYVQVFGECGNLNPHSAQVQMHVVQGTCGLGIRFDESDLITQDENTQYELIQLQGITPDNANNRISIRAYPNSACFFILNALEENDVPSNVIITEGAPTSRAVAQLAYPLIDSEGRNILNQAEGMHAIGYRPGYGWSSFQIGCLQRLTALDTALLFFFAQSPNGQFRARMGVTDSLVALTEPLTADREYLVLMRWGADFRVGYKTAGQVNWGNSQPREDFIASDLLELSQFNLSCIEMPLHLRGCWLWNVNRGEEWLEKYFEGFAN